MIAMQSMALDDEESYDTAMPIASDMKPDFPWELRLTLTDVTMKKLGIDPAEALQGIGGMVQIHALARITSASMNQSEDGDPCCRVELQIEDMGVDGDDTVEPPAAAPKPRLLYKSATA